MKDEYKILIGAIIVIVIVLVGAFALSGSNNPQPTATPTATPATATPTVIPGGGGGETPSTTPAVTPVPTPAPSTEPESGVKLTEFGYWITYPPLGPQNWSNPKTQPEWNVVFFNRTSDRIPVADNTDARFLKQVAVERVGDLSGTVNVTINSSHSENAGEAIHVEDYIYGVFGDNLTYVGWHSYNLTFGPGVSEQVITVFLNWDVDEGTSDGFVTLTIVGADGGYSIGHDREYTLTMADVPTVFFIYDSGSIWVSDEELHYSDGTIYDASESGEMVNVTLYIACSYVPGALTVDFYGDPYYNMTDSDFVLYPYTFTDPGTLMGIVKLEIDKDLVYDGYSHQLDVYIADSDDYVKDDYTHFHIFINRPV
jgi:hypothetical protein